MTIQDFHERIDRLVTLDLGDRGVEHLYRAARELQRDPLSGRAAEALAKVPRNSTVLMTTGSVSRAWISPEVGENDGPAGAAVIARALALGFNALPVIVAEQTLIPGLTGMLTSAGLSVLPYAQARIAAQDESLAVATVVPFATDDESALRAADEILDDLDPVLMFSTERVGRASDDVYYSMRGVDYGMGRARVDLLWDRARERGIPTVAVGDGGNEIGMGLIADAVQAHVRHGERICATSSTDVLVPAACSNWGCYGIAAALAVKVQDPRLLHTPEAEEALLRRGVDLGMINSVHGLIDMNVDGIPASTHLALAEMLVAVSRPLLSQ